LGLIIVYGGKKWQDNWVDKSDNWVDNPYLFLRKAVKGLEEKKPKA
jgi:hypothetical protein